MKIKIVFKRLKENCIAQSDENKIFHPNIKKRLWNNFISTENIQSSKFKFEEKSSDNLIKRKTFHNKTLKIIPISN